jgi:hypothetical protein
LVIGGIDADWHVWSAASTDLIRQIPESIERITLGPGSGAAGCLRAVRTGGAGNV